MACLQFKVYRILVSWVFLNILRSWSRLWTSKFDSFRPVKTQPLVYGHTPSPFSQSPSLLLFLLTAVSLSPQQVLLSLGSLSLSPLFWHLCVTMTEAFKPESFDKRKVSTNGHSVYPPCLLSLSFCLSMSLSPSLSPQHCNSYYFYLLTWPLLSLLTAPSL